MCADRHIGLLQAVGMLNAQPLPAIEQLARGLEPVAVPAGHVVFSQGDIGDGYYVIESGEAEVVGDGHVVATLGASCAALGPLSPRGPWIYAECPNGGSGLSRASAPEFGELLGKASALVETGSSSGRTRRQIHQIAAECVAGVAIRQDRFDSAAACA